MSSNNLLPLSNVGPNWPGVQVVVTETGFMPEQISGNNPYGFNLGTHVGDALENVLARRAQLQGHLGVPILWLNQVHGCQIADARLHKPTLASFAVSPTADASVSVNADVALAIMTADCLPVVFAAFDEQGKAVGLAAAHAGWRGLHDGVLQATASALAKATLQPNAQIKAWMGPAIGPNSFEVGQEVLDAFVGTLPGSQVCFRPGLVSGKYLADIYHLARLALEQAGITEVEGGGFDTLSDSRWFSHRRGQQQGQPAGRFATLIRLLPGQAA